MIIVTGGANFIGSNLVAAREEQRSVPATFEAVGGRHVRNRPSQAKACG